MKPLPPSAGEPATNPQPAREPTDRLDSSALLGSRDEIQIAHGGEIYRLRRTRTGKLILTK